MRLPWSLAALFALAPAALAPAALSPAAWAADWPDLSRPPEGSAGDGSNDAALVVAIEDYAFAQDIPGAVDNGKAWVSWFNNTRHVGLVKTLVNNQATREEILQAADGVAQRVKPGGRLWVVFIGHGAPSRQGDDGVLVGVDAQQTALGLESRSVTRTELLDRLDQGAQAETVLVLDACFSGKTAQGDLAPGLSPLKTVSAHLGARATILTAAKGDEYAGPLPDRSRPAFSYLVLGALRGWGDGNRDGTVTASEAAEYASDALFQTVTGRTQTPTAEGADLALARGREAAPDLAALVSPVSLPPVSLPRTGEAVVVTDGKDLDFGELARLAEIKEHEAERARQEAAQAAAEEKRRAEEAAQAAAEKAAEAARLKAELERRLTAERQDKIAAAAKELRAAATRDFAAISALVSNPTDQGRPVLEAYVARYGSAKVTIDDVSEPVAVIELSRVREALSKLGGTPGDVVTGKLGYRMVTVPAGTFTMGSPSSEKDRYDNETQHPVTISRPYLLGETEVTQGLWKQVMGDNPSHFSRCGDDCPVDLVSWVDSAKFANALSKAEGLAECYRVSGDSVTWPKGTGCTGYRLPTEAEWEYAARAGEDTPYAGGADLEAVGWVSSNSGEKTHRVGGKRANAWGLYDLSGNVREWTWDWYGSHPSGASTDPTGPDTGTFRVYRGGSWRFSPSDARVSFRGRENPGFGSSFVGLRLARSIP